MVARVGRPREHDERVAVTLLDAAEELVDAGGLSALSVRAVAERSSTTTRAVYSLFGSKAGLVAALGARTFQLLGDAVQALPTSDQPADDLVEAGVTVFRQLAINRPALFQIGVQQTAVDLLTASKFAPSARAAFVILEARFLRLHAAGQLPGRDPRDAATQFHALCEGLAAIELRGDIPAVSAERLWRDAFIALFQGLSVNPGTGTAVPTTPGRKR
jgi:AcrR family transcriptional regulator